jgi:hypothetical protein
MVKGNQFTSGDSKKSNDKFYGFTEVDVRAINPTRRELNKLLGKEDSDDDKPLEYLSTDAEGNKRVRLSFWLYSAELEKYFVHSFNLTDKVRVSKDGSKTQYINQVCTTSWADSEANLPEWFTKFTDKEKQVIGDKVYRPALLGEEELATLLRAWIGINWFSPNAEVGADPKRLLEEDYAELREMIGADYTKAFVVLLGVKTDEADPTKQYQQVYGKSFLPNGFLDHLKKNFKGSSDKIQGIWRRFDNEVNGEYGFTSFFKLEPAKVYDSKADVAASTRTRADITPVNNKY